MSVDMGQHFTFSKLFKFTLPTIGMMLFMSLYVIVDGFFVSNFCGSVALAAVNFVYPIIMILGTLGFMLGTGGTAVVAKTLGEGDKEKANRQFSLLVYTAIVAGLIFLVVGVFILKPLLISLGAQGEMLDQAYIYGIVLVFSVPACILQYLFQELIIAAGKPSLGFAVTLAAGIANIVLDAILIAGFNMGVIGAAIGTAVGEVIGGAVPLVYFARANTTPFRLGKTTLDSKVLGKACANGSSEMVSNIAMSVVSIAYNVQLLAYLGENGVAAYGVIMYVGMAFVAIFMGFIIGSSPLMSYQFGAQNHTEMQSLFRKSLLVVFVSGIVMFGLTRVLAQPLADIFVGYDQELLDLTVHAMLIYAIALLLMGLNMYASALFTALSNGVVSAIISFVRTFIFEIGSVFLLPLILGADGIWYSVAVAEVAALILSSCFVLGMASHYGYIKHFWKEPRA